MVLTDVWDTTKGKQKVRTLDQVVDIEKRLTTTRFSKFRSLYYKDDLPENSDSTSLNIDSTGKEMWNETLTLAQLITVLSLTLGDASWILSLVHISSFPPHVILLS